MITFIIVGIVLVALFLAYAALALFFVEKEKCKPTNPVFWAPALVTVCVWLSLPFIYEFPGWPTSTPITFTASGQIIKHPWGMFTLGLDGKFSNLPNTRIQSWIKGVPSTTILTENRKVRKIQPKILVELVDYRTFFSVDDRRREIHSSDELSLGEYSWLGKRINWIAINEMYNLNEAYSKDMSKFFNPLNEGQQREYGALIKSRLDPLLAKDGVAVVAVSFSIE